MAVAWPDIPGITRIEDRPCLPRRPEVVVAVLEVALSHAGREVSAGQLADRVAAEVQAARPRIEGMLGWLPVSQVVRWDPSGVLRLHAETSLQDLAVRYAAWIRARPQADAQATAVKRYVAAVVQRASESMTRPPESRLGIPEEPEDPPPPSARAEPPTLPELRPRLRVLLRTLDAGFVERERHLRAALLGLLAGQHVLLLGPPGTAKSLLSRALCGVFCDARYFEYLLSRFTHPDELFGPVSIPGLKEEDYRRLTEGFLPTASVAFLDEVFKANSAILNSLLTLINERIFHHGQHRDEVPLIGLIGASNELPDPEGGLGALYDRFLVRLSVPPVGRPESFLTVATGRIGPADPPAEQRLGPHDLSAIRSAAARVSVPVAVASHLVALWSEAREREWQVSDRRWRQAVWMLKVAAVTDGRRQLVPVDLLLLQPVLAPSPDAAAEVRDTLVERIAPRSAPEHDLHTQWMLLRGDRVAPIDGLPCPRPPEPGASWQERLEVRRASTDRFLAHHAAALQRLVGDRDRIERQATGHLWLHEVPIELLSAHIEAARELASILEQAEAYRDRLRDARSAARAAIEALPAGARRVYGTRLGCVLHLPDAGLRVGLGPAGERYPAPEEEERSHRAPPVACSASQLLDWIDGRTVTQSLLQEVPAWGRRQALGALEAASRHLRGQAVPRPPDLPR